MARAPHRDLTGARIKTTTTTTPRPSKRRRGPEGPLPVRGATTLRRWGALAVAVAVVVAAHAYFTGDVEFVEDARERQVGRQAAALLAALPVPDGAPPSLPVDGASAAEVAAQADALPETVLAVEEDGLELWSAPFTTPGADGGASPFTRIDGVEAGFEQPPMPRLYESMDPAVMEFGGLAAGDVHGDGWPDVLVGTRAGAVLYANVGGRFVRQRIDFADMAGWRVGEVALVDLDGDGALDVFFTTWMHGSHVLYNRDGEFSADAHAELSRSRETAVHAAAFADLDRDGDLEIMTGATTHVPRFFHPTTAVNHVWHRQDDGRYRPDPLPGPEGETLTLLATDLDDDGWPDLYVGNDYDEPDRVYLNDQGRLRPTTADTGPIPRTTYDTMSADIGDLDNDGRDELYLGGIAMPGPEAEADHPTRDPLQACDDFADPIDRDRCLRLANFQLATYQAYNTVSVDSCGILADPLDQRDCVVSAYHWNRVLVRLARAGAGKDRILAECEGIPDDFTTFHDVCRAIADSSVDGQASDDAFPDEREQVRETNLLYSSDGRTDLTGRWGAAVGAWTWNAKFGDLDNDGWQDLFIAEGTRLRPNGRSNIWYRNDGGERLVSVTTEAGLVDHNPTGSSLFLDYDLDGDLDLITHPFLLTPVLWRNDAPAGPGFELRLIDERSANRDAIGARVEIAAPDGRRQVREIKGSGGYQSHDLAVARFGLGDWPTVASIMVTWPDGETRELAGLELGAGRHSVVRTPG